MTIVDVVDALSYDRPYCRACVLDRVIAEVRTYRGKYFDPDGMDASLQIIQRDGLLRIRDAATSNVADADARPGPVGEFASPSERPRR